MIRAAQPRRFPVWRWIHSISGQVAMTRVVAQMIAGKKGSITHMLAARMLPMNSTARVMRVRSCRSAIMFSPSAP
jgi:hypothetical protein